MSITQLTSSIARSDLKKFDSFSSNTITKNITQEAVSDSETTTFFSPMVMLMASMLNK